ncbi:hypothetical protein GCM10022422_28070 [Flavobacterium ginsengisoli]|uniref:Uncharacterized protein n=2 Tax=Flavobacterium ginsengisoli TaxID=871694 RepID=A0ABP7FMS7_9FLAO
MEGLVLKILTLKPFIMKKFKKNLTPFLVFIIVILIASCGNEEIDAGQLTSQNAKIIQAKDWFESYKSNSATSKLEDDEVNKAFRNLDYYWENAKVIKLGNNANGITVPVKDNPEDSDYKGQKMLYLYESDSKFQALIQEIFPESKEDIDDEQKKEGFQDLTFFSGYIITWDLKKGFLKGAKLKDGLVIADVTNVIMFLDKDGATSKMIEMFDDSSNYGSERDDTLQKGGAIQLNNVIVTQKTPAPTPKDFSIVGAFGGDVGSNGNYGTPTGGGNAYAGESGSTNIATAPPSCESFNFIKVTGLWQVAMVKNINFRVLGISPKGVEILHVVSYPQAIYFGTPTNVKIGNTNITAGIAANTSARILQKTMQEVVDKYGGTDVSDLTLDLYFRERLENNYQLSIPGARVKFNSTENIPATNYKTNTWTAGNCN